jgi:uncharacterized protein (TIGR03435 family)
MYRVRGKHFWPFMPSYMAFVLASAAFCQPASRPTFDVASVKPTPPERQNNIRQQYCPKGGRFFASGIPVLWVLEYAYHLEDYEVSGAPAWMDAFDSSYDIEGVSTGPVTSIQCRQMVQSLLAERFKLATHTETREASVYFLTASKTHKMPPGGGPNGGVKFNGSVQVGDDGVPTWRDGLSMAALASYLSDWSGRPVIDRTGIEGKYGVTLDFSHRDGDDRPSVFTAVQEQLGLKLEPGRAPIEVMVIDHIERPSGN